MKATAYNNSAYALSEVIDNSFEADAKNIHVAIICGEGDELNSPSVVAILDDGRGMNSDTLRRSIQYGYGSHTGKDVSQITGLGRFGVGLLSATLNQCESLEVWSWQNGISLGGVAPKIELSIPSIASEEENNFLPNTQEASLPEFYPKVFAGFPEIHDNPLTGTLVVWRNFHNLKWKKAITLINHLAFECGRIYRNFIAEHKMKIVLSIWNSNFDQITKKTVNVVDPMFLQSWDDCGLLGERYSLGYFRDKPMFIPFSNTDGDDRRDEAGNVVPLEYPALDEEGNYLGGKYRILASYRPMKVLEHTSGANPGDMPFGRMARRIEGVSVLRAGREIMLDPNWLRADQTIDRWIAVSIDFDPSLDEYFGVANNKQSANFLSELSGYRQNEEDNLKDVAKNHVVREAAKRIHRILSEMRKIVRKQRIGERDGSEKGSQPESTSPGQLKEMYGKLVGNRNDTHLIRSDTGNPEDDPQSLIKGYEGSFYEKKHAEEVRPALIKKEGIKNDFVSEPSGSAAFFNVFEAPSVMIIKLNEDHPMYNRMFEILHPAENQETKGGRLQGEKAVDLIKKLLFCYARAECEASQRKKGEFESVRVEWGRIAQIVTENEED